MAVASLVIVFRSAEAAAQGSYVGASVFGDIVRGSHTDDYGGFESGGEAFGFIVRIDTRMEFGLESRIALTGHAQLVPGIRLQAADNIWLLRPAVGLNWMF